MLQNWSALRARLHLILQYLPQMLQYHTTTNPSSCNKIIFAWILQTDKQHVIYLKLSCLSASSHELSSWQVHELWNPTSPCTAHTGQCVHVYVFFLFLSYGLIIKTRTWVAAVRLCQVHSQINTLVWRWMSDRRRGIFSLIRLFHGVVAVLLLLLL